MTKITPTCKTCRKPKANLHCHLCQDAICKSCTQFLNEESFGFQRIVPEDLKHTNYCINCFDEKVSGPLADYNEILDRAREVVLLFKNQGKLTRFIKRKEDVLSVDNCVDKEEALLKLSFYAAEANFNTLIDVDVLPVKVMVGTYIKAMWKGTAVPTTMDPDDINPDAYRGV